MFDASDKPRIIGVPPGADFPAILVEEILSAMADRPPEDLARVRILVNTRRMERRLRRLFADGTPRLLPRIGFVTDVEPLLPGAALPPTISHLRRKLELSQLTAQLLQSETGLAARSSAMDLADTLAALIDEMQSEGVDPAQLRDLDVGEMSAHWERSLKFLDIANNFILATSENGIGTEARRRLATQKLCTHWQVNPPDTPVIVAGSTGSRSTTRILMEAVSRLPQGAILLPGFDFDLPDAVWSDLSDGRSLEDHPQYRFAALLRDLDVPVSEVKKWGKAPDPSRNRAVSLSLRPAQVTDQWLTEGPELGDLRQATSGLALIEAASPRDEALSIAIALREAVELGKRAAMITTDRTLSRRVSAILDRWNILPDDSAGVPLSLTPPGRFLREVVRMMGRPAEPEALIALLKHPLTRAGGAERGPHLLWTRQFEVFLRHKAVNVITNASLDKFAEDLSEGAADWMLWLRDLILRFEQSPEPLLESVVSQHLDLANAVSSTADDADPVLWNGTAGGVCQSLFQALLQESDYRGSILLSDYIKLFEAMLAAESDRDPERVRPDVMIWGTLEARVQGADLVILGGLNEGIWPEADTPDPWLNRRMRRQLGLLIPEGQIGLAAHDYQQASAAQQVILTRAKRIQDGEAVPSRWLNRLTNLLNGLPKQNGEIALQEMRDRGNRYLDQARLLDRPTTEIAPATRPAPAPPISKRPKSLAVTEIRTLIRDPYAIYAKHVLGLRPVPPLISRADARIKGIAFHKIVEEFFDPANSMDDAMSAQNLLLEITQNVLAHHVPSEAVRLHWTGQIRRIAEHLIKAEQERRETGARIAKEVKGVLDLGEVGVSIAGTADRIDLQSNGTLAIYDYKTGAVPTKHQIKYFDRQLLIEAVMAEAGVFKNVAAQQVEHVSHLHLGRNPKDSRIMMGEDYETVSIKRELVELLGRFNEAQTGYISRRAMEMVRFEGDYDHLARFGEWDASATTDPEPLT